MTEDPDALPLPPPPRDPGGRYRVVLVCRGNICRSPIAAVVLADRVRRAGLEVEVESAGTGGWHVEDPMDERAAAVLTAHGYDAGGHRARQIEAGWFDEGAGAGAGAGHDLVLVMDESNLGDVLELRGDGAPHGPDDRVRLFRDFDPQGGPTAGPADRVVPDPYYGAADGFEEVLAMVERTADGLVAVLRQVLGRPGSA